jgi:hypothetical protein
MDLSYFFSLDDTHHLLALADTREFLQLQNKIVSMMITIFLSVFTCRTEFVSVSKKVSHQVTVIETK